MRHIYCAHCGQELYDGDTVIYDGAPDPNGIYCTECYDRFLSLDSTRKSINTEYGIDASDPMDVTAEPIHGWQYEEDGVVYLSLDDFIDTYAEELAEQYSKCLYLIDPYHDYD